MNPPLCRCHGEPMEWNKDKRPRFNGGYWRCKVKHAEARRRYQAGDKGKKTQARYGRSEKGHATQARYNASPMGRLVRQLHSMTSIRVRY